MADINLLPEEERRSDKVENIKGRVTLVSIVILVLTAISAFVTLAFYTFLTNERTKLLVDVKVAVLEVESYKEVEELLVVIKDKSSSALLITDNNQDKVNLLTEFAQLIPQDVYFKDVNISESDMVLNGLARTSADVAGLVSSLKSSAGSGIVTDVQLSGLSTDSTGVYKFSLSTKLK